MLSHVALPGLNHCKITVGLPKDARSKIVMNKEMERHEWYSLWCLKTVMFGHEVELQLVEKTPGNPTSQLLPTGKGIVVKKMIGKLGQRKEGVKDGSLKLMV